MSSFSSSFSAEAEQGVGRLAARLCIVVNDPAGIDTVDIVVKGGGGDEDEPPTGRAQELTSRGPEKEENFPGAVINFVFPFTFDFLDSL